jgi:hypothetical protein
MAKPIEGIPPFKGKAAIWLNSYMNRVQPNPKRAQEAEKERRDIEKRVTPLAQ